LGKWGGTDYLGPKTTCCLGEGGRLSSTPGLQKNPQPIRDLGEEAVTPSHFHHWAVCRQTAVFWKRKISQLAFQGLSSKWISGGTTLSDCSLLSKKSPLCSPPAPIHSPLRKEERDHTGDKKTHIQARVIAILRMYFIQNNQFIWK